jgi:formylglycine-generating enzyme required for sulfatase activity
MSSVASSSRDGFRPPPLVLIPESWFLMGSEGGQDNERPVHRVRLDPFQLAARQITNADYGHFLRAHSLSPPPLSNHPDFNHPAQPVVAISWFEAANYCRWLSALTGRQYRLPTEAEWECAARGGIEAQLYPWGDAPPQSLPDYEKRWQRGPEPVALYPASAFGLYDMAENVHEWCNDWYQPDYYAISPQHNPRGPEFGERRASRGGSWRHHIKVARCAARSSIPPAFQYADYGFRVACDL